MIQLEHLTKKYGQVVAVDDLNLEVRTGEIFAFIGPNGAGKTTTVKLITGLLQPTAGRVLINGRDISADAFQAKTLLGYIPDQPFTYDKLTGREFLRFIAQLYGVNHQEFQRDLEYYVNLFQMSSYLDELIESYSLGMKQRLIITATFIHHPQVIIVDEPLVGLDPASTRLVKELFRTEAKEKLHTIFMSTHLLSVAEECADRIGIINKGKLVGLGTLADLKKASQTEGPLEEVFLSIVADEVIK